MSIVNFEENIKGAKRTSDVILESLNRFYDAKQSGALKKDELSKILTLEGKLFAAQVEMGKKVEEDVESFEKEIPNGKYDCFAFEHQDLNVAYETIKQANTVALFERENRFGRVKSI